MPKQKLLIIISASIIIILAGVAVYLFLINNKKNQPAEEKPATENPATGNNAAQSSNSSTASQTSLSYAGALKLYANRRIQFGAGCSVIPNNAIFKKGTSIMLDNRLSTARSIYLNSNRYYLGGYGFKIVTLTTTAKLPYTIKISCGVGQTNGQIILEK